ncbi:MAG: AprI/Inh family metalloprotease inhibitor [Methylocella sp.]
MRQLFGDKVHALSAAFILALGLGAGPRAAALTLDGPEAAVGQWELSLSTGPHSCRLALRGERVAGGFYVGMPAGCRRALPVLSNVVAWILPGDNRLDLADAYGKPLLDFTVSDGARLAATGPQGETYRLTFVAGAPAPANLPAARLNDPAAPEIANARVAAPRVILRPADVAGRYAVLREAGRDTGCMVTLDSSSKAFLAPACRDQGIVIFDPTAWRIVGGRLVLVARKGHTAQLDFQPDGTWLKDAKDKDAKSLTLKKF